MRSTVVQPIISNHHETEANQMQQRDKYTLCSVTKSIACCRLLSVCFYKLCSKWTGESRKPLNHCLFPICIKFSCSFALVFTTKITRLVVVAWMRNVYFMRSLSMCSIYRHVCHRHLPYELCDCVEQQMCGLFHIIILSVKMNKSRLDERAAPMLDVTQWHIYEIRRCGLWQHWREKKKMGERN